MESIRNKLSALWRSLNKTQTLRHVVQFLAFLLFPGLFLTVFNAIKDVVVALITGTFTFSALSAQARACRAAARAVAISFFSRSFWLISKASCRRLFSSQEEKLPFCTSIFARLMLST